MNAQVRKGFGFGLTSGVMTTLGLIVGLDAGTGSRLAVISGIMVIAIADGLSDAMGIHISEEATYKKTTKQIWEATISTFLFKFLFALIFVIPFLFLELFTAVIVCIVWGLLMIITYSYQMARKRKTNGFYVVLEHVGLTILVVTASYFVGKGAALIAG